MYLLACGHNMVTKKQLHRLWMLQDIKFEAADKENVMNNEDSWMDAVEDGYALYLARLQGARCRSFAREHAGSLHDKAVVSIAAGLIDEAICFREREFEFCCRAFGISDPYSRASMKKLEALRKYAKEVVLKLEQQIQSQRLMIDAAPKTAL
jgi:hypothetical protein